MAKSSESTIVIAYRASVTEAATKAHEAAEALRMALFDLNRELHPSDQLGEAALSAINLGSSGPLREVEAAYRLIEDLSFDIQVVAKVGTRAAQIARIANNTY